MEVCDGVSGAIGNTPLIRIRSVSEATGCEVLGKAEFMSVGGSVKDRPALYMLNGAEERGQIQKGGWVVEATAGNTGIGLAHVANQKGFQCLFCCPATVAQEKIETLRVLGAEVLLCKTGIPASDPLHFQRQAKIRAEELGGFFVNQFHNLDNMKAHYETTGPEIWRQTNGKVDGIALSTGTGGTIAGTSIYLKERNTKIECFMMDIPGSGVTDDEQRDENGLVVLRAKTSEEKAKAGNSLMEGIGSGQLYGNLAKAKLDGIFRVYNDAPAVRMAHYLLKHEGLFLGGSGALNVIAAYLLAKKLGPGHVIVTFLCDSGARYASKIFNPTWLKEKNIEIGNIDDLSFLEEVEKWNNISAKD